MTKIYFKSKLLHYNVFDFSSIISLPVYREIKGWYTFFECTQYISPLIFRQGYCSIFDKMIFDYKKIFKPICRFTLKIMSNISVRTVIMEFNTSSVFFILLFELEKMSHFIFLNSLIFALVFFLVPLAKQI